jgi:hypothetical protein
MLVRAQKCANTSSYPQLALCIASSTGATHVFMRNLVQILNPLRRLRHFKLINALFAVGVSFKEGEHEYSDVCFMAMTVDKFHIHLRANPVAVKHTGA